MRLNKNYPMPFSSMDGQCKKLNYRPCQEESNAKANIF